MAALVAGAAKAAGDAAPDAYQGLKGLIKRKFGGEPKAEMVLEEHESDPETYEAPLKKKLLEAGADDEHNLTEKRNQSEWHEFIEETAGSINDETFFRHPQPDDSIREALEWFIYSIVMLVLFTWNMQILV